MVDDANDKNLGTQVEGLINDINTMIGYTTYMNTIDSKSIHINSENVTVSN